MLSKSRKYHKFPQATNIILNHYLKITKIKKRKVVESGKNCLLVEKFTYFLTFFCCWCFS